MLSTYSPKWPPSQPLPCCLKAILALKLLHVVNLQPSVAPKSTLALLFERLSFALELLHVVNLQP